MSPPIDWIAKGHFARGRFCPEHGHPLRAWCRIGKLECPVRWCPYVEPQEDGLETLELSFPVPEATCERRDDPECPCADHQAYRRVLDIMARRRYGLFPATGEADVMHAGSFDLGERALESAASEFREADKFDVPAWLLARAEEARAIKAKALLAPPSTEDDPIAPDYTFTPTGALVSAERVTQWHPRFAKSVDYVRVDYVRADVAAACVQAAIDVEREAHEAAMDEMAAECDRQRREERRGGAASGEPGEAD